MPLTITRRYDPLQARGENGRWGGGGRFFMGDFTNGLVEIEGTFGELAMGADDAGDVRVAFRERGEARALDLGGDDLTDLSDALGELAVARDDLPDDAESHGVYEDAWFGTDSAHKVELYGSGVIEITFGADEDDPWSLTLDPPDEGEDDTTAFLEAIDEVLQGGAVEPEVERKYDPSQTRINAGVDGGQWVSTGAVRDALNLDGRIELRPGERLLGSGRVDGASGGIRTALTVNSDGRRMLRFGAGGEGYGQRNRDEGIAAWDGSPSRPPLPPAERRALDAEDIALSEEYDEATPDRQSQIEARREVLQEQLAADDMGFNGTANLDEYSWNRLVARIRPALAEAVDQEKRQNAAWDEIEALEAKGDFDPARMAELRRIARADEKNPITFDGGIVPGSEWGDVHFSVELDDPSVGAEVRIGVAPKGAPDDWGDDKDWRGTFTAAETRKLLRQLDQISADLRRAYSPENGEKSAPAGGQFAAGGGRVGSKGKKPAARRGPARPAAPAGPMHFDGKSGTGYGIKGGDPKVRTLQAALTRLGVTDGAGKGLAPDGKYGPKTTSAVKKLQTALGLKADGQVTPELLKQVTELKQLPPAAKPATPRRRAKTTRRSLLATVNRALRLGVEVRHPLLFDRAFALDDIQISRSGDGRTVEAYAACFDQPYEVRDQHGHYMEVIDRAAFNRTLSNGAGKSAMCLYNHGMNVVNGSPDSLAQVPLGTPIEIRPDGRGLLTVTRYNKSALADSVLEAIRNGDIRSQSFRGRILRSSPDRLPARNRAGGLPTITRHELGLTDYGPTPIPVNAGAEIMVVRSVTELAQDFAALDDDGRLELLRSLGIDLDGDEFEELQDEAAVKVDDTPTSAVELGAQDSPLLRHSGGQSAIAQRARAGRTARRIPDEATH